MSLIGSLNASQSHLNTDKVFKVLFISILL